MKWLSIVGALVFLGVLIAPPLIRRYEAREKALEEDEDISFWRPNYEDERKEEHDEQTVA